MIVIGTWLNAKPALVGACHVGEWPRLEKYGCVVGVVGGVGDVGGIVVVAQQQSIVI